MRPLLWSFEGARASDSAAARLTTWAVIAAGKHLFPFRTEKLSPLAPMVLGEQSPGRVGRRPFLTDRPRRRGLLCVAAMRALCCSERCVQGASLRVRERSRCAQLGAAHGVQLAKP